MINIICSAIKSTQLQKVALLAPSGECVFQVEAGDGTHSLGSSKERRKTGHVNFGSASL